ncbi:hypothetical protein XHC_0121 [Xanthomonas hortorum pv. carotae str. M081]|nr:hypothetical protein XHC_0121 [Xanthomonas hortorum pv. carotae str. M081]
MCLFAALAAAHRRSNCEWYLPVAHVVGNTFAHVRSGLLQNAHQVIEI